MGNAKKTDSVKLMYPDDAGEYFSRHKEGSFTLLDVRQPLEYEKAHLPGAKLVPLPLLADSLGELDSGKPVIVYCAVGGRSSAAAQLLSHQGFREVFHIVGGIEAWEGRTATGPIEFHLRFVRGDETPEEMIRLAYRMEEGMRKFHELLKEKTADAEISELLSHLVRAEEGHKKQLRELFSQRSPQGGDLEDEIKNGSDLMEGGVTIGEFLAQHESHLQTMTRVLEMAMMLEVQALDLYLRMADAVKHEAAKKILLQVGDEEKSHLAALGRVMDEKLGSSS